MTMDATNGLADLADAYLLASRAHAGQRRKGGDEPYISHPCTVAAMVAGAGADTDTVIAAVLHDVVEDTDVPLSAIASRFGERVAGLVDALSDSEAVSALPLPERKAAQAAEIADAAPEARLIKLADQTANLSDLVATGIWTDERRAAYLAGAERIAASCTGLAPSLDAAFDKAASALRASLRDPP